MSQFVNMIISLMLLGIAVGLASAGDPTYIKDWNVYQEGQNGITTYFELADSNDTLVASNGELEIIIEAADF
jgi:hypothetical protein